MSGSLGHNAVFFVFLPFSYLLPPREPWVRLLIGTGVSTLRDCLIIVIRHLTIDLKVSIVSGAYPQLPETFGGESGATPGHSEQA